MTASGHLRRFRLCQSTSEVGGLAEGGREKADVDVRMSVERVIATLTGINQIWR